MSSVTATFEIRGSTVFFYGSWTLLQVKSYIKDIPKLDVNENTKLNVDGKGISDIDGSGAWVILNIIKERSDFNKYNNFSNSHLEILKHISKNETNTYISGRSSKGFIRFIDYKLKKILLFTHFLGEVFINSIQYVLTRSKINLTRNIFSVIQDAGIRAMPIIAILSFLIGIVLSYQVALQLKYYGADIYIVDFIGIAMLREFSPLLTAIIVSGRTGSSFAALIGIMKINQEIDVLKVGGISPYQMIIIPRIIGLMIILPLLTFWSDIFGVLGSMFMTNYFTDINYIEFISRFTTKVKLSNYIIGLSKAPFFALTIAMVGCFHGFQVHGNANSVGHNTTKSVVNSIFLIILIDAIFSVTFSWK